MSWSLHEAKNRLSEVVRAAEDAPQVITVRGRERVVVLSVDAFRRLSGGGRSGLRAFLAASPWAGVELDLGERAEAPRPLDLDDDPA